MVVVSGDEQLPVGQARRGDADAWDVLFKRYQLPLYTYVFELLRDEQLSLDVAQETFVSAARHIGGLRADGKFGSWLFGIAHQKCLQRWRKKRFEEVAIEDADWDLVDSADDPSEWLIQREKEDAFMKALEQLAPAHRSTVALHFIEEFSLEEIAAITETPLGTVKSRLHYARKMLKRILEDA